ncbi:MAG: response regulator transcription factor [Bacteroidales bacterium]|nr:response regulator transcription factor [Bacteroidales bacterium]
MEDVQILVVDDEKDICEILAFNLENEGWKVVSAYSAEEALSRLTPETSLILLDVMMEGMSGYQLAERLRKEQNTVPIIFLTAKDTENDMLTAFSVGADDYIAKPFSIKEVIARVNAILKRTQLKSNDSSRSILTFGDLMVNLEAKEAYIKDKVLALTKTEFELFVLLASNPFRVYSRDEIIASVWQDTPYITPRTVDVHITRLRKKLGNYGTLINSRTGYGYQFDPKGFEVEL